MNKLYIITISCLTLVALLSCSENIFGSSSSGGGNCGDDIDCLEIEAEELFRNGKFKDAYDNYSKIVNLDSTRSAGYYGMAKAGMWWHSVTLFNLVMQADGEEIGSKTEEMISFFQNKADTIQNRYLQGAKRAYDALRELNRRDSITADSRYTGKPLSDMKYRSISFNSGFVIATLLRTVLSSLFFDVWGEGCIYKDKPPANPKEYGCYMPFNPKPAHYKSIFAIGEDGMPKPDMEALYADLIGEDGEVNAELIDDLNSRIDDFENDLEELIGIINAFSGNDPTYPNTSSSSGDLQQQLEDYKGYAVFYKLHNKMDNDGDGCVDEELMYNGTVDDTDGDGLYGEDTRVIQVLESDWKNCKQGDEKTFDEMQPTKCFYPKESQFAFALDNTDHNMNNNINDYFLMYEEVQPDTIITHIRVAWAFEPDFWSPEYLSLDNIGRSDMKKEIQIEKDKNGTRCWTLAERQARIGGCWKNYSPQDFDRYRNDPVQIEKGSMNPECKSIK